jgi:hypothetical protein
MCGAPCAGGDVPRDFKVSVRLGNVASGLHWGVTIASDGKADVEYIDPETVEEVHKALRLTPRDVRDIWERVERAGVEGLTDLTEGIAEDALGLNLSVTKGGRTYTVAVYDPHYHMGQAMGRRILSIVAEILRKVPNSYEIEADDFDAEPRRQPPPPSKSLPDARPPRAGLVVE